MMITKKNTIVPENNMPPREKIARTSDRHNIHCGDEGTIVDFKMNSQKQRPKECVQLTYLSLYNTQRE